MSEEPVVCPECGHAQSEHNRALSICWTPRRLNSCRCRQTFTTSAPAVRVVKGETEP